MLVRYGFVFALVTLCAPALAQGETGFLRGKGNLDLVVSFHRDDFEETRDLGQGQTEDGNVVRDLYNVYAAYGLTDEIDLTANGSYATADADQDLATSDEQDWQDLYLHVKWRFWRRPLFDHGELSLLARPGIKLPLTDYEKDGFASLGSGQVDLQARLIAHYQPVRGGWFAAFETGYDRRNGSPSDEIPFHVSVGADVFYSTWITLFYSYYERRDEDESEVGGFSNTGDFERYGVNLYVPLSDRWGLTGNYRISDDRRDEGDIDGFSVGVVARF